MPFHPFNFGPLFEAGVLPMDIRDADSFFGQRLQQVHGVQIVEIENVGPEREGDALLTQTAGVPLIIKTADCIPIVCADPVSGWVAGIHAGWRGLTANIVPLTFVHLQEKGAKMDNLHIGIGPSLGLECAHFSRPHEEIPEQYHWAIDELGRVDLWAILQHQLLEMGIASNRVQWMRVCTACNSEWFSWRRNADQRRFGTYVLKRPFGGKPFSDRVRV